MTYISVVVTGFMTVKVYSSCSMIFVFVGD